MERVATDELAPATRVLMEDLLERVDAAAGNWILEIHATDGRVRRVYRHDGPLPGEDVDERWPATVRLAREAE